MKSIFKFKAVAIILYLISILNFNVLGAKGMESFLGRDDEFDNYYEKHETKDEFPVNGYFEFYEKDKVKDFDLFKEDLESSLKNFLKFDNNLKFCEENFSFSELAEKNPLEQLKEYILKSFENYMELKKKEESYYRAFYDSLDNEFEVGKNFFIDNLVVEFDENGFCKLKIKKPYYSGIIKKISDVAFKCVFKKSLNFIDLTYKERILYILFLHARTFIKFFNDSAEDMTKFEFICEAYNDLLKDLPKFKNNGDNLSKFKNTGDNLPKFKNNGDNIYSDVEHHVMNEDEDKKLNVNVKIESDIEDEIIKFVKINDYKYKHVVNEFNNFNSFEEYVDFANRYFKYDLPKDREIRRDADIMKQYNLYNGYGFYHEKAMRDKDQISYDVVPFADMNVFLLFYFSKYLNYVLEYVLIPEKLRTNELIGSFSKKDYFKIDLPSGYTDVSQLPEEELLNYIALVERRDGNVRSLRKAYNKNLEEMKVIFSDLKKARDALIRSCFFENKDGIYKIKFMFPDSNKNNIKFPIDEYGFVKIANNYLNLYDIKGKLSNEDIKAYIYKFLKLFELYNYELYNNKKVPYGKLKLLTKKDIFTYKYFLFVLAYIKAFNEASYGKGFSRIPFEFFGLRFNFNLKSCSDVEYIKKLKILQKQFVKNYEQIFNKLNENDGDKFFNFMLDKSLNVKVKDEIEEYRDIYSLAEKEEFKRLFYKKLTSNFDKKFTRLKDYLNFVKYYINEIKKTPHETYLQILCNEKTYTDINKFNKGKITKDLGMEDFLINCFFNYLTYVIIFILAPIGFENEKFISAYYDKKDDDDEQLSDFEVIEFYNGEGGEKEILYSKALDSDNVEKDKKEILYSKALESYNVEKDKKEILYSKVLDSDNVEKDKKEILYSKALESDNVEKDKKEILYSKALEFGNVEKDKKEILDSRERSEKLYKTFLNKLKYNRSFLLDLRNVFIRNCVVKRNKDGLFNRISVFQNEFLEDLKRIIDVYNEKKELDLKENEKKELDLTENEEREVDLTGIEHKDKLAYRLFLFARAYVKLLNYSFAKYKYPIPYVDYSEAIYNDFGMNSNVLNYLALVRNHKKDYLLKIKDWLKKTEIKRNEVKKMSEKIKMRKNETKYDKNEAKYYKNETKGNEIKKKRVKYKFKK